MEFKIIKNILKFLLCKLYDINEKDIQKISNKKPQIIFATLLKLSTIGVLVIFYIYKMPDIFYERYLEFAFVQNTLLLALTVIIGFRNIEKILEFWKSK